LHKSENLFIKSQAVDVGFNFSLNCGYMEF
jgi:hypothetical protein